MGKQAYHNTVRYPPSRANALLTLLRYTGCSAPLLELTGAASRRKIIAVGAHACFNGYES